MLGRCIAEYPKPPPRGGIHVATKFATYPWRITPGSLVDACKASAARLGVESISVGQLHWSPSNYAPWQARARTAALHFVLYMTPAPY